MSSVDFAQLRLIVGSTCGPNEYSRRILMLNSPNVIYSFMDLQPALFPLSL
jgi:hypothetical protein